jgi:anti-sigma B factor antagonist
MPIAEFKIEVGAVAGLPDGAVVSFNGPIDARNVDAFKKQMDALRGRHFRRFLLQMGEVRYVNSSGLAYLINMVEAVQAAGGALVLFNVQPKVKVILETMGLLDLLRVFPSKAGAIRELKAAIVPLAPVPTAPPAKPTEPGAIQKLFRKLFGRPGDERRL